MIAESIHAEPEEIFFTSGGTESDNWAIKNYCPQTDIRHIITSPIEHHAILNACKSTAYNSQISLLTVDSKGIVSVKSLEKSSQLHKKLYLQAKALLYRLCLLIMK